MEERFKFRHVQAITGTFVLAIVVTLLAAIVLTGRSQHWFRRNVALRIVLPETGAAGIRQGSEVYFLGTLVGTVADVNVDQQGRMEARANIRRDFFRFVRVDSFAVVKKKFGVAGDSYFEITRGHGQPLPVKNASIDCKDQLPGAMEAAIEEVRSEAVLVAKKFSAGLDAWTLLGTNLVASAQRLDHLFGRVDQMAADLQQGKGTAGRLLTDPAAADELERLLAKANAAMDELKLVLGNVQQASTNFPAIAGAVNQSVHDLPALVAQTQQTMREIERLVSGIQRFWLLRGAVRQADADAAATNKTSRVKKP